MPLLVLSGLPNSGKSVRVAEIIRYLQSKHENLTIRVISEDSAKLERASSYKDSRQEKDTRGTLKSEVERYLTRNTVVILDSLNYIKGFRYELYCLARAQATPNCVLFVDTPIEMCKQFKANQPAEKDSFPDKLMDELAFRYETPQGKNRWDAPLIHVRPKELPQPHDGQEENLVALEDLLEDEANAVPEDNPYEFLTLPVLERVNEALFAGKVVRPNMATLPLKLETTNFVHELDRITQEVINAILEAQNLAIVGDAITIPETKSKVILRRRVNLAELRRLRRQFLKVANATPPAVDQIATSFVVYLNSTFETE